MNEQEDPITSTTYNNDDEDEPYNVTHESSCSPTQCGAATYSNHVILCPVYYMDNWNNVEEEHNNDIPRRELNEEDLYEEDFPEIDNNYTEIDPLEHTSVHEQKQSSSLFHMNTKYRKNGIYAKKCLLL